MNSQLGYPTASKAMEMCTWEETVEMDCLSTLQRDHFKTLGCNLEKFAIAEGSTDNSKKENKRDKNQLVCCHFLLLSEIPNTNTLFPFKVQEKTATIFSL